MTEDEGYGFTKPEDPPKVQPQVTEPVQQELFSDGQQPQQERLYDSRWHNEDGSIVSWQRDPNNPQEWVAPLKHKDLGGEPKLSDADDYAQWRADVLNHRKHTLPFDPRVNIPPADDGRTSGFMSLEWKSRHTNDNGGSEGSRNW